MGHGQAAGGSEEARSLPPRGLHGEAGAGSMAVGSPSGLACREGVRCGARALLAHDGDHLLPQGPTLARLDREVGNTPWLRRGRSVPRATHGG